MFDPFALVLAIFAAYRVTAFFIHDTLAEPLREFWWRRFPVHGFHYEPFQVVHEGHSGYAKAWPHREVNAIGGRWIAKHYKLGELLDCFFCLSVWMSAAATVYLNYLFSLPYDSYTILNFLAIAGGTEVLNNRFGRD